MALETKEREFAGLTFSVTQLPYFKAQRLFVRLLKLAGPALTSLATMTGKNSGAAMSAILDVPVEQVAGALGTLLEKLEPDMAEELTRTILSTARVTMNGKIMDAVGVLDVAIGGDFWAGLMLQAFALSVHFGNFSSARAALDGLGLTAKASALSESTTSTDGKDAS